MKAFLILLLLMIPTWALGHHAAEPRMRVVLITEDSGQTLLYVRLPAPLVFAEALLRRENPAGKVDASFLRPIAHQTGWAHYLDASQIAEETSAFARLVADAFAISRDGAPVQAKALSVAVHSVRAIPAFLSLQEAANALNVAMPSEDLFVGHAFIDAKLIVEGTGTLSVRSAVDDIELPDDIFMENIVIDFRGETPVEVTKLGQWIEAIEASAP